jgi:hypothetical protein
MRAALTAALLMVLTGCSTVELPFECDDSNWEPGQTCDQILEAARGELPEAMQIEKLTAVQGIHCPSSAECPYTPFVVTVYADLIDGRQVYVSVDLGEDGRLTARQAAVVEPIRDR